MSDKSKTVLLGVSGSIAAYKAAQLTSDLTKKGYNVNVLMSKSAMELVGPITFETLSGNRVSSELFDRNHSWNVQHIALAKSAEVAVVAPATANIIAKMAHGIADDMLSSTLLAAQCPKIVCPAMNTGMYENFATVANLRALAKAGVIMVEPGAGYLACGDTGRGRLCELYLIEEAIEYALHSARPLAGRRVLVSAGATREAIDPVRYITNHSTGKMGYAIARAARNMGASVTLVSSGCSLPPPFMVDIIETASAAEMHEAVTEKARESDIIVMAAAVADYRPKTAAKSKIKKGGDISLELTRTTDILQEISLARREGQLICGFSMETESLIENSKSKLARKGCDMIVANSIAQEGAGFGSDTNIAALITGDSVTQLPKMSKDALAHAILEALCAL